MSRFLVRHPAAPVFVAAMLVAIESITVAGGPTAPVRYAASQLSGLGPAGRSSLGIDINKWGEIAGMAQIPGDELNRWGAVRWTADGALQRLEPLENADLCWAHGIDDAGNVTGACRTPEHPTGLGTAWTREGTIIELNSATGGDTFSSGSNGVAAVGEYRIGAHRNRRAATWHKGIVAPLGYFGGTQEAAFDINVYGDAVGFSRAADDSLSAIIWIESLPALLGRDAVAFAINSRRDVVGYSFPPDMERGLLGAPTTSPAASC